MTDEKQQPKGKTRVGNISVTTWENEIEFKGEKKMVLNHVPEISYKEKDSEEWKVGKQYKTHELPKLILCLEEQYRQALLKE